MSAPPAAGPSSAQQAFPQQSSPQQASPQQSSPQQSSPQQASPQQVLAQQVLALLAVDPVGLGGAVLLGPASPGRDAWLAGFHAALPCALASREDGSDTANTTPPPWRRMPPRVAEARLIGGLDLAATLAAGRPVAERGLLAQADSGVLLVPMAERLEAGAAGLVAAALDTGEVVVERDGLASRAPARFACLLMDEGEGDERAPTALAERLAFHLDLAAAPPPAGTRDTVPAAAAIMAARARLGAVAVGDDAIEAICATAVAFGVPSLRAATFALRAAKAAAALAGRAAVAADDVVLAATLVLAPRATAVPAPPPPEQEEPAEPEAAADREDAAGAPPPPERSAPEAGRDESRADGQNLADRVLEATRAALPPGLIAMLGLAAGSPRGPAAAGRAGAPRLSGRCGRPAGIRRGTPGAGARLAIVDTLRAAVPWQPLRRAGQTAAGAASDPGRILVRKDDFRVARLKQRGESVTLFVVDASGSAALHRLAEVKGAVELILAECYIRRDSVALIAFRGSGAELVLPPTRSLARAKRALAGQAGGGGTPLAAALEAATLLADAVRRKGQTPLCVLLTDGKANVGFGGRRGRVDADADAQVAARAFRLGGCAGLVLDIAPRPGAASVRLATAMGARYQPLPHAEARDLSRVVLDAATPDRRRNIRAAPDVQS